MGTRISPSFAVAVLALVLAAGGTGYAAGKISSADIKDNTIKSKDVRDRALTGTDVKDGALSGADVEDGSLGRAELDNGCRAGEAAAFGGCVRLVATGPSGYQAALDDCSGRNGRLPSLAELKWIATHSEYPWADGNVSQYEFSADFTVAQPFTPIAVDRGFNGITNAGANEFWHHCVTY